MEYVIIVGEGRSGTTWLLDLVDSSRRTHCRNEPDSLLESSPLARLPSCEVLTDAAAGELERDWDAALRFTATHIGRRDLPLSGPKDHVYELGRRLGLARAVNTLPRKILAKVLPSLRPAEFRMPFWVGSEAALERAVVVIKMIQIPSWTAWVLNRRPATKIVHIVRHPGGFLNSWRNRHLAEHDPEEVRRANRKRLDAIRTAHPEWADRFGDIDAMPVGESELWYWRYAVETIHTAGAGKPQYHLVLYENLSADAPAVARSIFDFCGLEWDDRIARRVRSQSTESPSIATAWRSKLSKEETAQVERVLAGSPMERWWD
jgi:hypothetical protein